jgi:hypothetical protein
LGFGVFGVFDKEEFVECSDFLVEVFDLGFEGLVEFAELIVEFDDFGVLVEFFLALVVKSGREGTEESYGIVIGFEREMQLGLGEVPDFSK